MWISIAFGGRNTAMDDGEYASTLAMSEFWDWLQRTDCNDKGAPWVVKLHDRVEEDRDASNLFSVIQNHPCATSAQPDFWFFS